MVEPVVSVDACEIGVGDAPACAINDACAAARTAPMSIRAIERRQRLDSSRITCGIVGWRGVQDKVQAAIGGGKPTGGPGATTKASLCAQQDVRRSALSAYAGPRLLPRRGTRSLE